MKDISISTQDFSKFILIDDDELTNILNKKIINSVLPKMPVEIFLDIEDALDWLKTNDKNSDFLIFLDLNFPGKSGWDFLDEYQQFSVISKVIMLSSSIVQADKNKALSYKNVLQFLSKPLSFNFLETLLPN
jgi:response regulator of citrate/malate metabolism